MPARKFCKEKLSSRSQRFLFSGSRFLDPAPAGGKQSILKELNLEDTSPQQLAPSRLRDREASVYPREFLIRSLSARRAIPAQPRNSPFSGTVVNPAVHQPARIERGENYVRSQRRQIQISPRTEAEDRSPESEPGTDAAIIG